MKRRALIFRVAVLALPLASGARAQERDTLAAQVRRRMDDAPVQRGEFEQRKTLKGFKHALVSRGDYLVARERGVVWRTREPFVSTLVLTRDKLVNRGADGVAAVALDSRSEPGLRLVNQLLFALLAADLSALAPFFKVSGRVGNDGPWRLALAPSDSSLATWLKHVELEGEQQVLRVQWQEASGDVTDIRFQPKRGAPALAPDEAARFD